MLHMLGDYHSSIPTTSGLWVAFVLVLILVVITVVGMRREKLKRDRQRRTTWKATHKGNE